MSHTFHLVDYGVFSTEFARRLTPPYGHEDARSPAEKSVLNNLRTAYFNNDQLPIARDTSVEAAAVHLMLSTLNTVQIAAADLGSAYPAAEDLREASADMSGPFFSPVLLLDVENSFGLRLLAYDAKTVSALLADPIIDALVEESARENLVVFTFSHDDDVDSEMNAMDIAYAEHLSDLKTPPTLDAAAEARLVHSESYLVDILASGTWRPTESRQQTALALLDYLSDEPRSLAVQALFGVGACPEPGCGSVLRVHHVRNSWDLQLFCGQPCCKQYDTSALNIELKPAGAPPHYSYAPRTRWEELMESGDLKKVSSGSLALPDEDCGRGTCSNCEHLRYCNSPVLPQVVVAANGSPTVVLTDREGTADQIWDTQRHGYSIDGVNVRLISDGLIALGQAYATTLRHLDPQSVRILASAATALWMRTPAKVFRRLSANEDFKQLIPAPFIDAAGLRFTDRT